MDIRYDLRDYRDLFAKLKREADRFDRDPNGDNLFNTMVTAWSLADWILKDITPTPSMVPDLLLLTGKVRHDGRRDPSKMDPMMQICQDVADASKHGVLDRARVVVSQVRPTTSTYGNAIYGFTAYGDLTLRYAIFAHGSLYDARDVITAVVDLYEAFFTKYGLH